MVLDDLDRRILGTLQEDARRSYRTVAAAVGSTVPTVSARVRRMEDLGIIHGYTIVLGDAPKPRPLGDVTVACHQCDQATADPIEATLGGRRHAFCCPTCKATFVERYNRMRQA